MGIVGITSLGQYLVKKGVITEGQLLNALKLQKSEGIRIGAALIKLGYITEDQLVYALSDIYGYPLISLSQTEIDINAFKLIPEEVIKKYKIVPFAKTGNTIKVAICEPLNTVVDYIKFLLTGFNLKIYLTKDSEILKVIDKFISIGNNTQTTETVAELVESALVDAVPSEYIEAKEDSVKVEAPIIKLANKIIIDALKMRASDIHIEPYEKGVNVRYRIDGVLHNSLNLPLQIKSSLITRFKIMAHLDISERRLPQDGRIKLKISGKEVDFRVSTLPIIYGEKVVLRVLEKSSLQLDLTKLGFEEISLKFFSEALAKPYGMILVTGPTGSGKTTTLYSALMKLNKPGVNIMTVEDPVEYSFPGINQVQVKEDIGLTFASALRAFLRQDPDIIMVGEIRDFETAEIAVKAALTGHLVLSTLHTNDAASTITRLINMGIEPFLISSSLILIIAQRLVRKLCSHCKKEEKYSKENLIKIGFPEDLTEQIKIYSPQGCPECNNTGYSGRIALYEVMPIKEEIKELILTGAPATEIKKEAVKLGMITLRQSGINKIIQGITSVDEVMKITFED
ncbi:MULTISPECIES: type IV-A pilus assembly ATPase PilB [Thermodesulfovibrio]|uniref:Type IV-A pilus assembly ATPase PilB n=1 Tax=Thermodesulfovibrio yellowstonii (strain ATCC 51303 / DSM 11347 / YP87) TaxID=289376 RepID=B5YJV4_THEYD|nr:MULTISPECIES: type IV-A pilus assembly ATPase PilB [Thermodesulfovibrio]ACI21294.1 type IV-A pilus assembly ATPase PilB [Thermodesulfovibrio yellowstonii DSM 11347]